MGNISDINAQLQAGDGKRIAELTGYHYVYVSYVLNGKRPPNRRIVAAAEQIIQDRKNSDQKIKQKLSK